MAGNPNIGKWVAGPFVAFALGAAACGVGEELGPSGDCTFTVGDTVSSQGAYDTEYYIGTRGAAAASLANVSRENVSNAQARPTTIVRHGGTALDASEAIYVHHRDLIIIHEVPIEFCDLSGGDSSQPALD
jgi:hypothetical protein